MEENKRDLQICEDCKTPCSDEFKKVVGLKKTGLLIFLHKEKKTTQTITPGLSKPKKEETFILHNAGDKELKRADYIIEMCQYRTKCFQCRTVIKRVRSLLDEITDIKKNEVLGVCEHCKRANPAGKCRRCEFIVNKFLCNKVKMHEDKQNRFKSWLSKVNQLLHNILESENVCKHKLYKESSTLELEKLLQELKSPLEIRQPDIAFFPAASTPFSSITQSKEMLEELLMKLKSESLKRHSEGSLFVSPSRTGTSCVCKYFTDKNFEGRPSIEVLPHEARALIGQKSDSPDADVKKIGIDVSKDSAEQFAKEGKIASKDKKIKETPSKEKAKVKTKSSKEKSGKENESPDKEPKEKASKIGKKPKPKLSPEEEMLLKMMKEREKEKKKKEKSVKQEKVKHFAKIEALPDLIVREVIEIVEENSESVVECGQDNLLPAEMIVGTKVVPFHPRYKDEVADLNPPLLFKAQAVYPEPTSEKPLTVSTTPTSTIEKQKKSKTKNAEEILSTKGVMKYALSDREFIERGWTILPTTRMLRRMNIYKMQPVNPKYDWFERHKYKKIMFYDTCEKLAEIEDNGRGKWFYKNGMVALDYYNAQELNAGQRYVIYSSGEEVENGKKKPVTVLACFDYLGNGVVYDHYGNIRLKYNQTEGMVIDEKIGPPGRWKWHSLNEPPVLQPVFIDSHVKSNSCINDLLKHQKDNKSETSSKRVKAPDDEMLAIEFENFIKEKAHKLLQKFKPFQIRMKALKINDQFSLRVLDQSNISLMFRDGQVSLKLNLGMLLISSEIVDTDTSEVSDVVTPYDRFPPRTPSVAEIQHTLNKARRIGKTHMALSTLEKKTSVPYSSV